mmetsp:Transcript_46453/g.92222  ORF Transcript_46453/g.92222 Transcript_46453/m.92222 type:complete len:121 (+) Transcript_46453:108-470(+)
MSFRDASLKALATILRTRGYANFSKFCYRPPGLSVAAVLIDAFEPSSAMDLARCCAGGGVLVRFGVDRHPEEPERQHAGRCPLERPSSASPPHFWVIFFIMKEPASIRSQTIFPSSECGE